MYRDEFFSNTCTIDAYMSMYIVLGEPAEIVVLPLPSLR